MKFQNKPKGGQIVVIEGGYGDAPGTIGRIITIRDTFMSGILTYLIASIRFDNIDGFIYLEQDLRPATEGEKKLFRQAEKEGKCTIHVSEMKAHKHEAKPV